MLLSQAKQAQLDTAIETLLAEPLSEFQLLKALQEAPYHLLPKSAFDDNTLLFQVHFTLYNALYRMQHQGIKTKSFYLDILPTKIEKLPFSEKNSLGQELATEDKLKRYYLDWNNFSETTADDIDAMLENFWKRLAGKYSEQELEPYLAKMDFNTLPTKSVLKARYLQLSNQWHPDKGGDAKAFSELNDAYQILKAAIPNNP